VSKFLNSQFIQSGLFKRSGLDPFLKIIKDQYTSFGDLTPVAAAANPVLTLGANSASLGGMVINAADYSRISYLGGNVIEPYRSTFPANLARTAKNITFPSTSEGLQGIVEFNCSCPQFEYFSYGQSVGMRLIVDGEFAGEWDGHPSDGTFKHVLVDFTAISASIIDRHIRMEFSGMSPFGGLVLDTSGGVVTAPADQGISLCYLGDSFTECEGAPETRESNGYVGRSAKKIGVNNYAASGFGGTGYVKDLYPGYGETRPSLEDRQDTDAINYDAYVVAMGINDDNGVDISSNINAIFDTLRTDNPTAPIFVLGTWGNGSGGLIQTNIEGYISSAVAGRAGFYFIPVYQESFTKIDSTHPDEAGHIVLGDYVAAQILSLL